MKSNTEDTKRTNLPTRRENVQRLHPLFTTYKRRYLSELTGYSLGYLCRIATGQSPLTRSFIDRACFSLNQPECELFFTDEKLEEGKRKLKIGT